LASGNSASNTRADLAVRRIALTRIAEWLRQQAHDAQFRHIAEDRQPDHHARFAGRRLGAIGAERAIPPRQIKKRICYRFPRARSNDSPDVFAGQRGRRPTVRWRRGANHFHSAVAAKTAAAPPTRTAISRLGDMRLSSEPIRLNNTAYG
jgi:hypothetical protein